MTAQAASSLAASRAKLLLVREAASPAHLGPVRCGSLFADVRLRTSCMCESCGGEKCFLFLQASFFRLLACVFHHPHLFRFSLPLLTCLRLLSASAEIDCDDEQRDEHTHHSYPGQLRDRERAEGQTTHSSTASNPQIEA